MANWPGGWPIQTSIVKDRVGMTQHLIQTTDTSCTSQKVFAAAIFLTGIESGVLCFDCAVKGHPCVFYPTREGGLAQARVLLACGMVVKKGVTFVTVSIALQFSTFTYDSYNAVYSWRHLDPDRPGVVSYSPLLLKYIASDFKESGELNGNVSVVKIDGEKASIAGFECNASMLSADRLDNTIKRAKDLVATLKKLAEDGTRVADASERR